VPTYPPINGISTVAVALRLPSNPKEDQFIQNVGTVTVFLGQSAVTTATGIPFPPNSKIYVYNNSVGLYAIAAAGATGSVSVGYGAFS
jgi:hypothetical protein